jgi:protein TonB
MDKNKSELNRYLSTDVLDIIFLNRNKSYGAYELRKNYHKRVKKTLTIVLTGALLVSSIPLLASLNEEEKIVAPIICTYKIQDVKLNIEEPEVKLNQRVKEKPIENIAAVKNVTPEIVPDEEAKDDLLHTQEELKTTNTGPVDKEGEVGDDLTTVITKDPVDNGGGGTTIVESKPDDNAIYDDIDIEQLPEFPGGEDELMKYLSNAIKYPERAIRENAQGKVVVGFVVNKNGEIEDLKVKRSIGFGCDDEAIRVIKSMPKWKPGKFNGRDVNVYYDLPIQFTLEGN